MFVLVSSNLALPVLSANDIEKFVEWRKRKYLRSDEVYKGENTGTKEGSIDGMKICPKAR